MALETSVYCSHSRRRLAWVAAVVLLGMVLMAGALRPFTPSKVVLYNETPSMPNGYYKLDNDPDMGAVKRDDIVVYPIPKNVLKLVRERRYIKPNVPLLKPLTAKPGDHVCTDNRRVVVNTKLLGYIPENDSNDLPLPWHRHCGRVPDGVFYSFSTHARSFDSRHYGPIPLSLVTATASPLWTW